MPTQAARALSALRRQLHESQASWEGALCAQTDPDTWFPEKGQPVRTAKRVCERCPLQAPCLEAAVRGDEQFGVWGGLSERERRKLRRDGALELHLQALRGQVLAAAA